MAIPRNIEFYREALFKIINIDTFENEHWKMLDMLEKEKDNTMFWEKDKN